MPYIRTQICDNPKCKKEYHPTRDGQSLCSRACVISLYRGNGARKAKAVTHSEKTCQNPDCRKKFIPKSPEQGYCKRDCFLSFCRTNARTWLNRKSTGDEAA